MTVESLNPSREVAIDQAISVVLTELIKERSVSLLPLNVLLPKIPCLSPQFELIDFFAQFLLLKQLVCFL